MSSISAPASLVTLYCLREVIRVGERHYPIYTGFLTPIQITSVAVAPSFSEGERQEVIASDVLKTPMKNWQRPLSREHWEKIARTFTSTRDFMPNPVLLSQNASYGSGITSAPQHTGGGTYLVHVVTLDPSGGVPLWIIDGQHRITGLANSGLANEKIPVVLLLNDPHETVYSGTDLAKIFAQVTTQAQPLRELHHDWLSYAFDLGPYASGQQLRKAMMAVAKLVSTNTFLDKSTPINNVFFDKIRFNDYLPVTGFQGTPYGCTELKDLVFAYYYNQSLRRGELSPDEIARQISLAYSALMQTSAQPFVTHCILGDEKHRLDVMRNGFIAACLLLLARRGVPQSWKQLFDQLKFGSADWDFSWTAKLSASDNARSFRIARQIFLQIFEDEELPQGIQSLNLYFRGNNAELVLHSSKPTNTGAYSSKSAPSVHRINPNQTINVVPIQLDRFIRLRSTSANAEVDQVEDLDSPRTDPTRHRALKRPGTNKGLLIDTSKKGPLKLNFRVALFGGRALNSEVDITW